MMLVGRLVAVCRWRVIQPVEMLFEPRGAELDELHGVEMRFVDHRRHADVLHDRQLAVLPDLVQRRRRRMQAELGVERQRGVGARNRDLDVGAGGLVEAAVGAGDRRHQRKPVHAAAQENRHQDLLVDRQRIAESEGVEAGAAHRGDRRRAALEEGTA